MRVSMKVDYGVRALVELAQRYGEGPVPTADVAAHQNIPEPYLDQLLSILNKSGLVRSRRGPQGGHMLARPPHEITLEMVMRTLEGTSAPLDCLDEPSECILSSACAQRQIWRSVEEAVQSVLSSTSIADLANRQRQLSTRGLYQI
ncbi:HTH-type transcriptional regulator CymR [bacterium HR23]|nr:HTH-type transcriptional regulator CymR [bacterium HR23]